jgi:hypothetical protein
MSGRVAALEYLAAVAIIPEAGDMFVIIAIVSRFMFC